MTAAEPKLSLPASATDSEGEPELVIGTKTATLARGGRVVQTRVFDQETAPDGRPMRAGSLLVTFREAADRELATAAAGELGALATESVGGDRTIRVQVRPDAAARTLAEYRSRPDVERVEPDYVLRATRTPDDPRSVEQWALAKVSAPAAWDRTTSSPAVRIAILDCGIFGRSSTAGVGHPDVRDKVVAERDFTGSLHGADDYCDHGTHVAAIAAAATNNGVGVAGVGFDASLINAKVLDDNGTGSVSTVIQGLVWAAEHGAKVINLSLGGEGACPVSLQDAIDYAWARGAVIVAAAGNEGSGRSGVPANCANVLSVAATDQNDRRASFSNHGVGVDVAAPGVGILSANYVGGYALLSGTSQASPHVAGLAALVWSTGYGTSNQAVVERITATADRIAGTGTLWSHGRINAAAAVAALTSSPSRSVSGIVRNAATGAPVRDATVSIVGTTLSVRTNAGGAFVLRNVPGGTQSLRSSAPGLVTDTRAVNVTAGITLAISTALMPARASGDISLVLTWGSRPVNLDAHLSGPTQVASRFHVSAASRSPVRHALLNRNDVDGSGPETITIRRDPTTGRFIPGTYRYWVRNADPTASFAGSRARIAVVKGGLQVASYEVASAAGDIRQPLWHVVNLTIDADGKLTRAAVQQLKSPDTLASLTGPSR